MRERKGEIKTEGQQTETETQKESLKSDGKEAREEIIFKNQ